MRKTILTLISIIVCAVATANGQSLSLAAENGISQELAEYRSRTVSDVAYRLHFNVPDSLPLPVTGQAEITFRYQGDKDLPIDFKGKALPFKPSKSKKPGKPSMVVNGVSTPVVKDEGSGAESHIVLPRKLLRQGTNTVKIAFASSDASLNRHHDFLYTLFVPANAHSCFPCFDQPDLKGRFTLSLDCPDGWEKISSADSHPIPTYLFSFVCGKFQKRAAMRDGRAMTALFRETDPKKVAQLDKVFDEAALSIKWLERYTGTAYPFDDYSFAVLPGYQFGGMEHPGAIQYTDRQIFLGANPTPDEELKRLELIAHETAHMWFGDLVTMRWFDDVWTKEVFANFLANKISREVYPDINHELNFLKAYQLPAMAVDRTDGTHPIQQPLDNLKNAGLLYGNIIYDKAPVMMRKLEEQTNKNGTTDKLRDGLRAYLRKHSYGNATWDDLISILDSVAPRAGLRDFSEAWVKQKGLPTITVSKTHGTSPAIAIRQTDPYNRGLTWQQTFSIGIDYGDSIAYKRLTMDKAEIRLPLSASPLHIYPNIDGRGYGRFVINEEDIEANINLLVNGQRRDETAAYATLLNLHENFLMGRLSGKRLFSTLCDALANCENPLIGSTIVNCMETINNHANDSLRHSHERKMLGMATAHKMRPVRQQMLRTLATNATDKTVIDTLYNIWLHQNDTTVLPKDMLNTSDYTHMAWHLASVVSHYKAGDGTPCGMAEEILATQRATLRTDDERNEFDYVSRACTADTTIRKQLFNGLIPKEGRSVEPWARQMLSLLCQDRIGTNGSQESNTPFCTQFIKPGLDNLLQIQQTSDIFFPGYWLTSLLAGQHSTEARNIVADWIETHHEYPTPLMNKIKQASFGLFCPTME